MSPLPITGIAASSILSGAFALTGKLPLQLDETVVPVVVIGQYSDEVFGPGAIGSLVVPAPVGALRAEAEISLPQVGTALGAGIIVESVSLHGVSPTQLYQIGASQGLPAPTHLADRAWRDIGTRGLPSAVINGKNDAAASFLVQTALVYVPQFTTVTVPLNWILQANPDTGLQQGLMVRCGSDTTALRLTARWRERVPR